MCGGAVVMRVCVGVWVAVVAGAAGQASDDPGAAWSSIPTRGIGRYITNPTGSSFPQSSPPDQGTDSSVVTFDPNASGMHKNGHSYNTNTEQTQQPRTNPVNSHTGGGGRMIYQGEATHEGPHIMLPQGQVSGTSSYKALGGDPESQENENLSRSDVNDDTWTEHKDKWSYQSDEWVAKHLPDPDFPKLPTPHLPPQAALIAVAINKTIVVERPVSEMSNVTTLHFRYFMSNTTDPDTAPHLEVYYVVNNTRKLYRKEDQQGAWQVQTLHMDVPNITSVLFEGLVKNHGDLIALSNVNIFESSNKKSEPLDEGDQLTLIPDQASVTNTTQPTQQDRQDPPSPEEVNRPPTPELVPMMNTSDKEDNATSSDSSSSPPSDFSSQDNPLEQTVEEETDNITETPTELSDIEALPDSPENETISDQVNGSMAGLVASSSMASVDVNSDSDYLTFEVTTAGYEGETESRTSSVPVMMEGEADTPQNNPDTGTGDNADNRNISSIPGVTTDALQTTVNTSVTPLLDDIASSPLMTPMPSGDKELTEGQVVPTSANGSAEILDTKTTLEVPQANETSMNDTSFINFTLPIDQESTAFPSAAGNNTEAVMAEPVSSASWQVFQVFLVLCVIGFIVLGFLYWKKRRRQDDEIPVFTRGAEYPNPSFSMEDAANFVTRGRRNAYKTIE